MISNHSVMWGDPPKPNVWQIKHTPDNPRRGKSEKWEIHSPLLRDSFVIYKRRPSGNFNVFYDGSGEILGNDGDWDLEYILSNEWYMEYLKPLLESGHIRMRDYNLKLASGAENVEVMWGDPPKPNAWKVFFEDGYGARNDRWKVMSPLMEGRIEIVEDGPYFRFSYVVSLLEKKPLFSIPFNKLRGSTLNKALFNNSVWEKIRPYVANGTITLNVPKVASEQPFEHIVTSKCLTSNHFKRIVASEQPFRAHSGFQVDSEQQFRPHSNFEVGSEHPFRSQSGF